MVEVSKSVLQQYLNLAQTEFNKVPVNMKAVRQYLDEAMRQAKALDAYEDET